MNKSIRMKSSFVGFASSIYLGLAYAIGISIFIFGLHYTEIGTASEKLNVVMENQTLVFISNLILYVFFGPVLIVFTTALKKMLPDNQSLLVTVSGIFGYVWAGSLVASGMTANASLAPLLSLYNANPAEALQLWHAIDIVTTGTGNGNGEILGGLFTLGFSCASLAAPHFPRAVSLLGITTGTIGLLSIIPYLQPLTGLFGITQMIWFFSIGILFLKKQHAPLSDP